jgi:hypothetical protein
MGRGFPEKVDAREYSKFLMPVRQAEIPLTANGAP